MPNVMTALPTTDGALCYSGVNVSVTHPGTFHVGSPG